ncbi:MAG: hypothetical protein HY826_12820 [Actinobacteria bacterium]|nr:hypothetical protein [Actinomycetota bacterium]
MTAIAMGVDRSLGQVAQRGPAADHSILISSDAAGLSTLRAYDPVSGESTAFGYTRGANIIWSMAFDGTDLFAVNWISIGDHRSALHRYNVGTSSESTSPPFAFKPLSFPALEFHPQTGQLYGILRKDPFVSNLYTVDPATAQTTFVAQIQGSNNTFSALAISRDGRAFVFGLQGPFLYSLDLTTGLVTQIGTVGVQVGAFLDAAFDGNGSIWASFESFTNPAKTGLYRIDPPLWHGTQVLPLAHAYAGLAFVPNPEVSTYCSAKTSAQGCTPTIHSVGYPSATADLGFKVSVDQVPNQELGQLMWGVRGRAAVPFVGGTLCIRPPVEGTAWKSTHGSSVGTSDCSGSLLVDINMLISTQHVAAAAMTPGTTVECQFLMHDSGFTAPNDWALSEALEFTVMP